MRVSVIPAIKKVLCRLLPRGWARLLPIPILAPHEYREIVGALERAIAGSTAPQELSEEYWAAILRKWAHVIDKGVQRHDYETGHSAAAYRRAQEALARIHSPTMLGDPSVVWARGKLRQYEACQRSDCAPQGPPGPSATTYRYETLVDAVKTRRSIRSYSNRPVPRDVINKIVEGINWSPCSCCRQPAKVFVTHDPELAKACLATCKGASGFGEFVPCFMSFCVDLRPYDLPREVFLPAVDLGLGIQNCCLIAHSLGLSLTLLSWAQHDKEEGNQLRALLGIPTCYEIMVNGALGYPDSGAPVPDRKSLASTLVLRESPTGAHQHRTKCGTTDTTQHG